MKRRILSLALIIFTSILASACERNDLTRASGDSITSFLSLDKIFGVPSGLIINAGGMDYPSGTAYDFGSQLSGTSGTPVLFSIYNRSDRTINLIGATPIQLSGANPGEYAVSNPGPVAIAPAGSVSFTLSFNPTSDGLKGAILTITSDDTAIASYVISLAGTGTPVPVPDIYLKQGGTEVGNGTLYDFGTVTIGGSSADVPFDIQNLGSADLTLTGAPMVEISGADASDFAVTIPPTSPVLTGASVSFSLQFTPGALGTRTATLTIYSDDPDEASYSFTIQGTGSPVPVPEINVHVAGTTYSAVVPYNFGTEAVDVAGSSVTFTIENTGTGFLNLSGSPIVTVSGANAADFTVAQPALSSVPNGSSTTFSVTFTPQAAGLRNATLSIANDDSDENPYTINLNGTGVVRQLVVSGNNSVLTSIFNPLTLNFIAGPVTSANVSVGSTWFDVPSGPDAGKRILIHGNVTTTSSLYDPLLVLFVSGPGHTSSSSDAHSFKVVGGSNDGKIVLVLGGGSAGTDLYDPSIPGFTVGSNLSSSSRWGSHNFSIASGRTLVIHGNGTGNTSIYDPTIPGFTGGPLFNGGNIASSGCHSFRITSGPEVGNMLVFMGNTTNKVSLFNMGSETFMSAPNSLYPIGIGAHSFEVPTGVHAGKFIVIPGSNSTNTMIYDPAGHSFSPGPTLFWPANSGALSLVITVGLHAGKVVVIQGGGTKNTSLYDPATGTFSDGPQTAFPVGGGSQVFSVR